MFIPLHIYSEYSFLQSGLTLDKLFAHAKKYGYTGLGISDKNVLCGLPHFENDAHKYNLDAAFGVDIEYKTLLLSLFIVNETGYLNLVKISSNINSFNENSIENLITQSGEGLLCIISSSSITNENAQVIDEISRCFYKTYIGLEIYKQSDKEYIKELKNQFATKNVSFVAFPHIKYLKPKDAIALEICKAIANDEQLESKNVSGLQYLHSNDEYYTLYDVEDINETENILRLCHFQLTKNRGTLLKFSDNSKELLKKKCLKGLSNKGIIDQKYFERLNYELDVIDKMGYNDYFLIVEDYVQYAKANNIYVGPGRGSAAGSIVSFALNITTPDPLKYDLLFERFLNPSRVTMPDIDVDFEDTRRADVLEYIITKYGKDRVSNIITYQTIGAKQALRDVGRVFNYATHDIDYLSKSIGNSNLSLRDSYRQNPNFRALVDSDSLYLEIVSLASKIEGLIRQSGIHAAGIVINDEPIELKMPVLKDENGLLTTQYEMNYLENQGFLKMDILSLRNLTIIHQLMDKIRMDNYYDLPITDEKALQMIASNLTTGIFQLESVGMKKAIKTLEPSTFEDIVALLALFRPGPMDNIPLYARRKKTNEKINYENTTIEKILSPTYGIIIYQEQIIQIAVQMAGFSLSKADNFRRAISKKNMETILQLKNEFIQGSISLGYSRKNAENVFDTIEKFANYGFNRAHSVAYAIISTQMAYLKAHYPLEFFCVLMDGESSNNNPKFINYYSELKKLDIKLNLPDINISTTHYEIYDKQLFMPLTNIKGLPKNLIIAILEERKNNGPFVDFFDFVTRLISEKISESQILALIDSGACDKFANRASLRKSIKNAILNAKFQEKFKDNPEILLFSLHYEMEVDDDTPTYDMDKEFETLGIILSKTSLLIDKEQALKDGIVPFSQALATNNEVTIAGLVKNVKQIWTRKKEQMAYLTLIDDVEIIEVTVFPNVYSQCKNAIKQNGIVIVQGKKDYKKSDNFIANNIRLLEDIK